MISIATLNWRFGILILLVFFTSITISQLYDHIGYRKLSQFAIQQYTGNVSKSPLHLPVDYLRNTASSSECNNMFDVDYLYTFADSATAYTTTKSPSQLTCLRRLNDRESRVDSFCIGGAAEFRDIDGDAKFGMRTELLEQSMFGKKDLPKLQNFPTYMYATGPKWLLDNYVKLEDDSASLAVGSNDPIAILIKREGAGNLWHCMQELFSLYATIDILRMTADPSSSDGRPLLSEADAAQAHVVILDDLEDGPYFDLWDAVAKGPVLRLNDIPSGTRFKNIILPIPGGASPLWQGNWDILPCDHSQLLGTFSRRIHQHFFGRSEPELRDPQRPLVVTYSDRTEKRRLIGKDENLQRLQERFPEVEVRRIDFANLSFTEQVQAVSDTDILVGVHGAGLTHSIFLPPDSTVVEIIPKGMGVQVYRNLAKLGGHRYFGCHAPMVPENGKAADFYSTDIHLEEENFQELMEIAIKSMYNRGLRNQDVVGGG